MCTQLCEEIAVLSRVVRREVSRALGWQTKTDDLEDPLADKIEARIGATLRSGQGRQIVLTQLRSLLADFKDEVAKSLLERVDERVASMLDDLHAPEPDADIVSDVIARLAPLMEESFGRIARSEQGRTAMVEALEESKKGLVQALRDQIDAGDVGGINVGEMRDEITRALEVYDEVVDRRVEEATSHAFANSDEFKELLDERFQAMVGYLQSDVLPKVISNVLKQQS